MVYRTTGPTDGGSGTVGGIMIGGKIARGAITIFLDPIDLGGEREGVDSWFFLRSQKRLFETESPLILWFPPGPSWSNEKKITPMSE